VLSMSSAKDWGAIKLGHVFTLALVDEPVTARVVGVTKRRVEVRGGHLELTWELVLRPARRAPAATLPRRRTAAALVARTARHRTPGCSGARARRLPRDFQLGPVPSRTSANSPRRAGVAG